MRVTRENLNQVIFENENARLLIEDVVAHTSADLYYYRGDEEDEADMITERNALNIWQRAVESDGGYSEPVRWFPRIA